MLESVISLCEAENLNNNASHSENDMTLEAKEDKREEETTTPPSSQHFTKNPNRGNTQHIKAKHHVSTKDNDSEHDDNEHKPLGKQDSDRVYENFTIARKEGRPIYAVRTNYRFVLHKILLSNHENVLQ